jgi:hypothetical protein
MPIRNVRRALLANDRVGVPIPGESPGRAWRGIAASGSAVLVSCFSAIVNWWTFSAPRRPLAGYAWELQRSPQATSPFSDLALALPREAATLLIAFSVFLAIRGNFSPRRFVFGTLMGLPVMALSEMAWTYFNLWHSLPGWLDMGFLIPGLLALATSIWAIRPPGVSEPYFTDGNYFVPRQVSAIEQEEGLSPLNWIPSALALAIAGSLAWLGRPMPRPQSLLWNSLWLAAVRYVLLVQLGGILAQWLGYVALTYRTASRRMRFDPLIGAAAMVWLAPLILFLSQVSWWALLASVIVASSAARAVYSGFHVTAGELSRATSSDSGILTIPPSLSGVRQLFPAMAAAICLNLVIPASLARRAIAATILCGVSAGIISWQWAAFTSPRQRRPASLLRAIVSLALCSSTAIAFTAGGLTRYLHEGSASGVRAGQGPLQVKRDVPSYRGVILFAEKRPERVLIAPRPFSPWNSSSHAESQPLNIPFDGVYWFFQPPDHQPRQGSLLKRGSPAELRFHSNDLLPLVMEARQNLGQMIDIDCCSAIQVTITNAELDSSFVALELSLANTTLPGTPVLPLGAAKATDSLQQTLTYSVPASRMVRQFDEVIVVFHRSESMAKTSAKIAIHQFVLVPRSR